MNRNSVVRSGVRSSAGMLATDIQFSGASSESEPTLGVVTDGISDLTQRTPEQVRPPPEFGHCSGTKSIAGIGTRNDHMRMLIDIGERMSS